MDNIIHWWSDRSRGDHLLSRNTFEDALVGGKAALQAKRASLKESLLLTLITAEGI